MNLINIIFSLITGKLSSSFLKLVVPLVSKQAQLLIVKLLPQAISIVAELASSSEMTNKQKQKQAFDKIGQVAKKEGIEAGTSLINLIIELAVAQTKK